MITIDELRAIGSIPKQEGLGVIKFRFRGDQAYHFYSGDIHAVRNTGIHNHPYGFTSEVLKGEIKNYIYKLDGTDPDSTYQSIYKKSKLNANHTVEQDNVKLVEECVFTTAIGQSYSIEYTTLHKIECITPNVITHLTMHRHGKYHGLKQTTVNYIIDTTLPIIVKPHPPKSESQCWEIIEAMLND